MKNQLNKRILVFNVNWIGDVLFSTATLRNIRSNFPESFIACVIPSRCYPVLKGNPYIDEIVVFDEKDRHKSIFSKMRFISLLKRKKFDTAILLHGSLTRALLCKLSGIANIIGYDTKKRGFLLTKRIAVPKKDSLHRIDYYLNIIEKAGLRLEDRFLDFFIGEEDDLFAENFLKKEKIGRNDLIVGINAGGNWDLKRWPKEYWAQLADLLISELNSKVIITGGPGDLKLAREIAHLMKEKPVFSCGMNLKQSAALFKKLDLFISADTGPLHIANAVGTRNIIAIFGPTHQMITGPFPQNNVIVMQKDTGCLVPCYIVDCKDNRCMKAVTPKEVFEQAKRISK